MDIYLLIYFCLTSHAFVIDSAVVFKDIVSAPMPNNTRGIKYFCSDVFIERIDVPVKPNITSRLGKRGTQQPQVTNPLIIPPKLVPPDLRDIFAFLRLKAVRAMLMPNKIDKMITALMRTTLSSM